MILHINGVLLIIISFGFTSSLEVECKTNKCIYKCCDSDQHMVFAKTCRNDRKKYGNLDFSNFPLYSKSESPVKTGKSLKDVYEIIPGRFRWNDNFSRLAYDYAKTGHNRYLTEVSSNRISPSKQVIRRFSSNALRNSTKMPTIE